MYKIYMKLLNSIFSLIFSLQDITSQNLNDIVLNSLMFSLQDITSQNLHDIVLNSLMFSLQDITSQNLHEIVKLYFSLMFSLQDITSKKLDEIVRFYLFILSICQEQPLTKQQWNSNSSNHYTAASCAENDSLKYQETTKSAYSPR